MKVTIISTSDAYSNPTSAEDHYSYLQLLPGMITDENTNGLQQFVEGSSSQSASYITIANHYLNTNGLPTTFGGSNPPPLFTAY